MFYGGLRIDCKSFAGKRRSVVQGFSRGPLRVKKSKNDVSHAFSDHIRTEYLP